MNAQSQPPAKPDSSSIQDIREGPVEEYWERLRHSMGPEGLITYWYLGRAFNQTVDPDTMEIRADMRNAGGGIMAAPLAIAAPETGGWKDREVVPAPMTYSLHVLDPARDVQTIRVTRETVRRGRKIGFSRSLVTDAHNPQRVVAITTGTGVTLGEAPPGFQPIDLPPDLRDTPLPPLAVVFGARRDPEGWRLPELTKRLASTSASLHLGPIHVVCEAAATEAAAAAAGPSRSGARSGELKSKSRVGVVLQIEHWEVHFASPGRNGPFLASAEAWRGPEERLVARFTLMDEGNAGVVVATGAAAFRVTQQADRTLPTQTAPRNSDEGESSL
jgi:hypothetical protein